MLRAETRFKLGRLIGGAGEGLVMVAASENPDFITRDLIDEPVLLIYPARPAACEVALERLRLPDAFEGIALHIFYQIDNPQRFWRSCSTHQAKSSKADGSNSKFLKGSVERDSFLSLFSFQKAALHVFAS